MTNTLQRLSNADLSALAAALRSGRLSVPFSEVAVRRYCAREVGSEVASEFERLATEGMQSKHLALLLDTVVETRTRTPSVGDMVELVWTGPEAPGVANRDTAVVVRELFGSATTEVLVAGFAVYQGREVFRRLAERMAEVPALRVRLFVDVRRVPGDATPSSELVWKFLHRFRTSEWPGDKLPELYYDPRSLDENQAKRSSLHAKCIVIDRKVAFVTSANFTEAAQTRNIEVGALVRSPIFARELADHFETLASTSVLCAFPVCQGDVK
jgi:phosphatidylserine/phosphatidylglycerophosphate/cardiolipin synthase-like enzyme